MYQYSTCLTTYEKEELLYCNKVYFMGLEANKASRNSENPQTDINHGFDDEKGRYKVLIKDHLCFRYEVIRFIGRGSFGQVVACKDHKTGEMVAVKILKNANHKH